MKRYRQTLEELVALLSEVETAWMDDHSAAVIDVISSMPQKESYQREDVAALLDADFDAALTTIRLALEMSKDEFVIDLKNILHGKGGTQAEGRAAQQGPTPPRIALCGVLRPAS